MQAVLLVLLLLPGWGKFPDSKAELEQGILPPPITEPVELTDYDTKLLARLGAVECRGMGEQAEACTRSVVSTVLWRIEFFHATHGAYGLSDGTVFGTLDHNYQGLWQFPPWVTRGCEFVSEEACLDWVDLEPFLEYVQGYLEDGQAPCKDYLYYDSLPGGNSECVISIGSQWIEFHSGWGWEPAVD